MVMKYYQMKIMNWKELFVNSNDGSNEGLIHLKNLYFSVQFHPEARAGPTDTVFLFDIFIERCKSTFNIKIGFMKL